MRDELSIHRQGTPAGESGLPGALSRREVLRRAMLAVGASALAGSTVLLQTACSPAGVARGGQSAVGDFSASDIAWLDEVAETILPQTETPGAKAAAVGAFIAVMVTDCMAPEERNTFRQGMQSLEQACVAAHGVGFADADDAQRLQLLTQLDAARHAQAAGEDPHYFAAIKELTVLGYFTSEVGYNQALRYAETPGSYDPDIPYDGGPLWARHA